MLGLPPQSGCDMFTTSVKVADKVRAVALEQTRIVIMMQKSLFECIFDNGSFVASILSGRALSHRCSYHPWSVFMFEFLPISYYRFSHVKRSLLKKQLMSRYSDRILKLNHRVIESNC